MNGIHYNYYYEYTRTYMRVYFNIFNLQDIFRDGTFMAFIISRAKMTFCTLMHEIQLMSSIISIPFP